MAATLSGGSDFVSGDVLVDLRERSHLRIFRLSYFCHELIFCAVTKFPSFTVPTYCDKFVVFLNRKLYIMLEDIMTDV